MERKKVKVKLLSCVRLSDPMDCSLPGSSVHRIFQATVLEWVAIAFSGDKSIDVYNTEWGFQVALVVKNPPVNTGELRYAGLIPGSGRSPGGWHGNPL